MPRLISDKKPSIVIGLNSTDNVMARLVVNDTVIVAAVKSGVIVFPHFTQLLLLNIEPSFGAMLRPERPGRLSKLDQSRISFVSRYVVG
jgi:hypothetical protein